MDAPGKHFRKRDAILRYLQGVKTHPSAEAVFTALKQEIPDLSLGTVYRNLALFKSQGLIQSVATVSGVERFDGCPAPHVHFICQSCGRVDDLMDLEIPQSLTSQAEAHSGGKVTACQLSFTGLCRECISNEESGESA